MTLELPADRRQVLVPVADRTWPSAVVVARDAHAGRRYLCPCGWEGWSAFGRAHRHREACPMTPRPPRLTAPQALLLDALEPMAAGEEWGRFVSAGAIAQAGPSSSANRRATANMAAGRVLRRLHAMGLVARAATTAPAWQITAAGLEALQAHRNRPRRIVTEEH